MPKFIQLTDIGARRARTVHINVDTIRTIHEQVVRGHDGSLEAEQTIIALPETELHVEETVQQVLDMLEAK